jgi:hypothetical protein
MANAVVIKSTATLANKRLRILGQDRLLNGGSVCMFDTKPALYPAQNASFSGMKEAVSGRSVAYSAGNTVAPTYTGNMATFPSGIAGTPGFGLGAYTDTGIDLAVRQAAGSTRFLYIGWVKFGAAGDGFSKTLFNIAQNAVATTSAQNQLRLHYTSAGINIQVAGQAYAGMFIPALNTVYQISVVVDTNSTTNITSITLYAGTNSAAPIRIGGYTVPYVAFSAMTATGGACISTYPYAPTGSVSASGMSFGRTLLEDLSQSQRDPERQLFLDWQLNAGRFS